MTVFGGEGFDVGEFGDDHGGDDAGDFEVAFGVGEVQGGTPRWVIWHDGMEGSLLRCCRRGVVSSVSEGGHRLDG